MFLLLAACPLLVVGLPCDDLETRWSETVTFTVAPGRHVASASVRVHDPGSDFLGGWADLSLTNRGADTGCATAVYLSDREPDTGAVEALDAADGLPPEVIEGIGRRVYAVNLPPDVAGGATYGEWAVPILEEGDEAAWLTVVTCGAAPVEASILVLTDWARDSAGEDCDGLSDESVAVVAPAT